MIIAAIIVLSTVVLVILFSIFQALPVIPQTWQVVVTYVMPHVVRGVKFLNDFMYPEIVWPLAVVTVTIHAVYKGYCIAMWVVKKIPMFGVSD